MIHRDKRQCQRDEVTDQLLHSQLKVPSVSENKHIALYSVIQKNKSIFWEATVSVNVRKQTNIKTCLILNDYRK
jgi:hypothetical protein